MSDTAVEVEWRDGQRFEGRARSEQPITLDGTGVEGPSPPEALLLALAACMGVDVVEILTKMRVPLDGLTVRAEGDRLPEPPRRFSAVRLYYHARGVSDDSRAKLERAVELSRDRYCSVLHTLQPDLDLAFRLETG